MTPTAEKTASVVPIERTASATLFPYETSTSTCRSFVTISSGVGLFLGITVLLLMSKDIPQRGPVHWGCIRGSCEWRRVGIARTTYPFVRITTSTYARLDSRLSYRIVAGPGIYNTTVTRLDLFRASPI